MIATTTETDADYKTITILAKIQGKGIRILLDSGVTGNYMSQKFVHLNKIPVKTTDEWTKIVGIDGETITEGYKKKTSGILMRSGKYATTITFNIVPMDTQYYNANLIIDWASGTVAVDSSMIKTKTENRDIEKILNLHEESGTSSEKGQANTLRKTRKVTWTQELEQQERKREIKAQARQIATVRPKPKELYKKELAEVKAKLPEKYYNYIELFVKKEYRLPNHPKEYEVRIPLKSGFKVPSVKQHYKSQDELEMEDKLIEEFLAVGYIREGRGSASARALFVPKKDGTKQISLISNGVITISEWLKKIFGKSHFLRIKVFMTKLMEAGLTLKIKKCEFDITTVNYLGMIYIPEGLKIQPEKVDAITNWPTPANIKEVQGFLGATGYVRRYIRNYSEHSRSMTELLKKDEEFVWNNRRQKVFDKLKQLVTEAPILTLDDLEKQKIIRLGASEYILRIALEQVGSDGIV
ncbi:retrovirus polyprotein, putative [Talaromyces stipitatus ATCC 10500]|uniref:Retrovirus polyprotein, putative n=1 Tax=Talaromyces stipitatus (strain ATCC 10500 / CBS 375.48 / QM 6759 / NRRL 1006) TaxID=441959 RepID=B8MA75_TALSN|nr:retrovirus polyprotein, putative [Talaromyces stipitatus ATCC 10500]EED18404.1 retrovirus polyprotein, putative [Talaromyces stipitatus ATCC 10500]